jgi:succinate-semialdehyde dehydrogenase/glutarate-semialdehyde dehydrogenase
LQALLNSPNRINFNAALKLSKMRGYIFMQMCIYLVLRSFMATPYATINPATGETLKTFEAASDADVRNALDQAAERYRAFKATDLETRKQLMLRVSDLYLERRQELAQLISLEMGKPVQQALGEVQIASDIYRYYAENAEQFTRDEELTPAGGGSAIIRTEPIGVLLGIMPWNYPYYQVARFAAPNLMLGNTILLKHAANCPQSALAMQQIFDDAELPSGCYTNLFASHEQISTIIADPRVQGISLTGSERAGAHVAEQAGRNLKKVVLELGGSDPFIVLDDHNLDDTVKAAVNGRMSNAGQACTSPKRFIVLDAVYDRFVELFQERVARITPGDPLNPETRFGPVSTKQARAELLEQIHDAVEKGASLLSGGNAVDGDGAYLEPTLLSDLTPEMRAWGEELFGPVAQVFRVHNADEAIALANSSVYGLGAAVFGADDKLTQYVAEQLEAGMVFINANSDSEPDMPFGGVKRSGFGRELGPHGITEFANKKLIRQP